MDRVLQIRQILSTRGLTLYRASQKSAELFGRPSEFYLPHNLYSALARPAKIPSICQILTLSQITNYRLSDWLSVFGFELDVIPRLRLLRPRQQTAILDSTVYDPYAWIPWFAERIQTSPIPAISPLTRLLTLAPARRAMELLARNERKSLYAVVGEQDVYARPYFAPGSVIRADPRRSEPPSESGRSEEEPYFLVEHGWGWSCSRLIATGKSRVLLQCSHWPCAEREFSIGREARILGAVDAEIRPMTPNVPSILESKSWSLPRAQPARLLRNDESLKSLLRQSRLRIGLSFRQASAISREIADALSDELYFAAPSTLSDYETLLLPPRQVQKLIALCVLYGIGFEQFLRACGLPVDKAGREPIPDELLPRSVQAGTAPQEIETTKEVPQKRHGSVAPMLTEWTEIPLFLRLSLDQISGLKNLSFSDLFWVGNDKSPRHPLLVNAKLVAINRRARRLAPHNPSKACDPCLHIILRRDGSYLCGQCALEQGHLVVDGYPRGGIGAQRFRNGVDAEIAGQVTAILRRLP